MFIIDFQGFQYKDSKYFIKELAIYDTINNKVYHEFIKMKHLFSWFNDRITNDMEYFTKNVHGFEWKNPELPYKEILDSVRETEDQEQGDEEYETHEPKPSSSIKEALEAAKLWDKYFLFHQDASISQNMNKISKKLQQDYWCSKRRRKITDYTQ
ncbi:hypothetical protein QE152_g7673 [Popillia japonica]|uniref:Uncharacterized protein n=1 Tax=Popillia japonica TaxID=7064 RepID=A0AAW1M8W5_POPJA